MNKISKEPARYKRNDLILNYIGNNEAATIYRDKCKETYGESSSFPSHSASFRIMTMKTQKKIAGNWTDSFINVDGTEGINITLDVQATLKNAGLLDANGQEVPFLNFPSDGTQVLNETFTLNTYPAQNYGAGKWSVYLTDIYGQKTISASAIDIHYNMTSPLELLVPVKSFNFTTTIPTNVLITRIFNCRLNEFSIGSAQAAGTSLTFVNVPSITAATYAFSYTDDLGRTISPFSIAWA